MATTKTNVSVAMTIQFLYQLLAIFKSYFGGDLDENIIRKHFVLIYEILDGLFLFKKKKLNVKLLIRGYGLWNSSDFRS